MQHALCATWQMTRNIGTTGLNVIYCFIIHIWMTFYIGAEHLQPLSYLSGPIWYSLLAPFALLQCLLEVAVPLFCPHSSSVLVIQRHIYSAFPETAKHADDSAEKYSNWNPLSRPSASDGQTIRSRRLVAPAPPFPRCYLSPSVFKSGVEEISG